MAKLNCVCGNQLSNVLSPNKVEGYLLRDIDLEFDGSIESHEIIEISRSVWECDKCGRLAMSVPDKHDSTVKWYRPEDEMPGNLMAFDKPNPAQEG